MRKATWHRQWKIIGAIVAGVFIVGPIAIAVLNPALTRYIESEGFRVEMEKHIAQGLHHPTAKFAPIKRTGFLTAATESFKAENGRKATKTIEAHGITTRLNPFAIVLHRCQLDELHIERGEVDIQVYQPKPEPSPPQPWYHVFLPDRAYLKNAWSDPADVKWRVSGKDGGIFGTRLVINSQGRDFEYQAAGGTAKMAMIPDLQLRNAHLLITKKLFSLYNLDLSLGEGLLHAEGTAGTRENKSVDFKFKWDKLPVRPWVPAKWKGEVAGTAAGDLRWKGDDLKPNDAIFQGTLRVSGGRVSGLPLLEQIAAVTKRKDLESLTLNEFAAALDWTKGKGELKEIAIEDEGKFRIEGTISINHDSLGGAIQLGVARAYLDWLPKAEEVFTRNRGGYLWTTVHLSGTLDAPGQDLSPRILEALKETPGSFFGAAFRALGAWLEGGD